jgi:hypothetical protein
VLDECAPCTRRRKHRQVRQLEIEVRRGGRRARASHGGGVLHGFRSSDESIVRHQLDGALVPDRVRVRGTCALRAHRPRSGRTARATGCAPTAGGS